MLFTEATAKLPTILTYVLCTVLFRPLHSKQVGGPAGVPFPTYLCRVKKQSLAVFGVLGRGVLTRREKRLAPGIPLRRGKIPGPRGTGPGRCSVSSPQRGKLIGVIRKTRSTSLAKDPSVPSRKGTGPEGPVWPDKETSQQ